MGPAEKYLTVVGEVEGLINRTSDNDPEQAAYMVARAALLLIGVHRGGKYAAEKAYQLGDEMVAPR